MIDITIALIKVLNRDNLHYRHML